MRNKKQGTTKTAGFFETMTGPVQKTIGSIGVIGTTAMALAEAYKKISHDMQRKKIIEDLGRTDPVLSKVEPEQLMDWYATIYHLAPTVSLDKSSVQEILQNFARFGRVDVNTLKMLADTEKAASSSGGGSQSWGDMLGNLATSAKILGGETMNAREILTKLGMALYLHKAMIKDAQKGKEAVEYLKEKGVFGEGKEKKS